MAVARVIPGCIPFFSPLVQSLFVVERIHPLIPSLVSFIFLFYFFICFVLFRFYLAVLSLFLFLWLLLASFSLFNDCSVTKKKKKKSTSHVKVKCYAWSWDHLLLSQSESNFWHIPSLSIMHALYFVGRLILLRSFKMSNIFGISFIPCI
jgi:hypothetical protein